MIDYMMDYYNKTTLNYHNPIIQVRPGYREIMIVKVHLTPIDYPTCQIIKDKIGFFLTLTSHNQ
jgi:hypothetical protein